ncbi:hypothetical protein C8J56DRAFT_880379 [Mycena floridula]|nr:hypothetical protein C8J56DRAFT_880379 [Mycena floridula]
MSRPNNSLPYSLLYLSFFPIVSMRKRVTRPLKDALQHLLRQSSLSPEPMLSTVENSIASASNSHPVVSDNAVSAVSGFTIAGDKDQVHSTLIPSPKIESCQMVSTSKKLKKVASKLASKVQRDNHSTMRADCDENEQHSQGTKRPRNKVMMVMPLREQSVVPSSQPDEIEMTIEVRTESLIPTSDADEVEMTIDDGSEPSNLSLVLFESTGLKLNEEAHNEPSSKFAETSTSSAPPVFLSSSRIPSTSFHIPSFNPIGPSLLPSTVSYLPYLDPVFESKPSPSNAVSVSSDEEVEWTGSWKQGKQRRRGSASSPRTGSHNLFYRNDQRQQGRQGKVVLFQDGSSDKAEGGPSKKPSCRIDFPDAMDVNDSRPDLVTSSSVPASYSLTDLAFESITQASKAKPKKCGLCRKTHLMKPRPGFNNVIVCDHCKQDMKAERKKGKAIDSKWIQARRGRHAIKIFTISMSIPDETDLVSPTVALASERNQADFCGFCQCKHVPATRKRLNQVMMCGTCINTIKTGGQITTSWILAHQSICYRTSVDALKGSNSVYKRADDAQPSGSRSRSKTNGPKRKKIAPILSRLVPTMVLNVQLDEEPSPQEGSNYDALSESDDEPPSNQQLPSSSSSILDDTAPTLSSASKQSTTSFCSICLRGEKTSKLTTAGLKGVIACGECGYLLDWQLKQPGTTSISTSYILQRRSKKSPALSDDGADDDFSPTLASASSCSTGEYCGICCQDRETMQRQTTALKGVVCCIRCHDAMGKEAKKGPVNVSQWILHHCPLILSINSDKDVDDDINPTLFSAFRNSTSDFCSICHISHTTEQHKLYPDMYACHPCWKMIRKELTMKMEINTAWILRRRETSSCLQERKEFMATLNEEEKKLWKSVRTVEWNQKNYAEAAAGPMAELKEHLENNEQEQSRVQLEYRDNWVWAEEFPQGVVKAVYAAQREGLHHSTVSADMLYNSPMYARWIMAYTNFENGVAFDGYALSTAAMISIDANIPGIPLAAPLKNGKHAVPENLILLKTALGVNWALETTLSLSDHEQDPEQYTALKVQIDACYESLGHIDKVFILIDVILQLCGFGIRGMDSVSGKPWGIRKFHTVEDHLATVILIDDVVEQHFLRLPDDFAGCAAWLCQCLDDYQQALPRAREIAATWKETHTELKPMPKIHMGYTSAMREFSDSVTQEDKYPDWIEKCLHVGKYATPFLPEEFDVFEIDFDTLFDFIDYHWVLWAKACNKKHHDFGLSFGTVYICTLRAWHLTGARDTLLGLGMRVLDRSRYSKSGLGHQIQHRNMKSGFITPSPSTAADFNEEQSRQILVHFQRIGLEASLAYMQNNIIEIQGLLDEGFFVPSVASMIRAALGPGRYDPGFDPRFKDRLVASQFVMYDGIKKALGAPHPLEIHKE